MLTTERNYLKDLEVIDKVNMRALVAFAASTTIAAVSSQSKSTHLSWLQCFYLDDPWFGLFMNLPLRIIMRTACTTV